MYGFAGFLEDRRPVEYAEDGEIGHGRSLRAMGCPEHMIKGVIACAKRTMGRTRTAPRNPNLGDNSKEVARLARLNAERCRKPVRSQAERIAAATEAVRVDRINMSTEQQQRERADAELRERMQNLAGITNREKSYRPQ